MTSSYIMTNIIVTNTTTGHWLHTQFSSKELKGVSFENIQLFRECKSRKHSKFLYGLYDCTAAKKAKDAGEEAYDKYKEKYLHTNMTATSCLQSYECVNGSYRFDRDGLELRSVCGSKCMDDNNGYFMSIIDDMGQESWQQLII
jgi:hypothetical protein